MWLYQSLPEYCLCGYGLTLHDSGDRNASIRNRLIIDYRSIRTLNGATTYAAVVGLLSVDELTLVIWCVSLAWKLTEVSTSVDRRTAQSHQTPVHRPVHIIIIIIITRISAERTYEVGTYLGGMFLAV